MAVARPLDLALPAWALCLVVGEIVLQLGPPTDVVGAWLDCLDERTFFRSQRIYVDGDCHLMTVEVVQRHSMFVVQRLERCEMFLVEAQRGSRGSEKKHKKEEPPIRE